MRIKWLGILSLLAMTLLAGCAGMNAANAPLEFTPHDFAIGKYAPKVDNLLVIIDASESMAPDVQGVEEYPSARNFVSSLNQSIPTDVTYNAGLRSFGHDPKQSKELTALPYGMTQYSRAGFAAGLDSIKYIGGNSPLSAALKAAGEDLKSAQGSSAIIVVSDGVYMEDSPGSAASLKAEFGDKLCIYTIQVGDSAEGKKTLAGVAKAGQCGTAMAAADLTAPDKFAGWVENILLKEKPAPAPAPVAAPAPPGDSDGDGVTDDKDKCPDTIRGAVVDKDGCAVKFSMQIEFDFDKADIRPMYHDQIAKAAEFIKMYPDTKILVAGHTDSIGDEAYNQGLSLRRAKALEAYMIANFGINAKQLYPRGYGETRPVASNDTKAGQQSNRRVEFVCCTVIPAE